MTETMSEVASKRGASNRTKGAEFERRVSAWLRGRGWGNAERGVRNGWRSKSYVSADPYDIVGTPGVLWSLKDTHVSEEQMHRWLREVHDEAVERGLVGVLVWKRKGSADVGRSWAYRYVEMHDVLDPIPVRLHLVDLVAVLHAEGFGDADQ